MRIKTEHSALSTTRCPCGAHDLSIVPLLSSTLYCASNGVSHQHPSLRYRTCFSTTLSDNGRGISPTLNNTSTQTVLFSAPAFIDQKPTIIRPQTTTFPEAKHTFLLLMLLLVLNDTHTHTHTHTHQISCRGVNIGYMTLGLHHLPAWTPTSHWPLLAGRGTGGRGAPQPIPPDWSCTYMVHFFLKSLG